jgi:hypothetical protein
MKKGPICRSNRCLCSSMLVVASAFYISLSSCDPTSRPWFWTLQWPEQHVCDAFLHCGQSGGEDQGTTRSEVVWCD